MSVVRTVVVVDDDEDDFFLTQRVLRRHVNATIVHVESGRAAIDYLAGRGAYVDRVTYPLPEVMFVDLKMAPGIGRDLLEAIRDHPAKPLLRIYVLTGSNEPRDHEFVKNCGVAAGYIVKPLANEHVIKILPAAQ